MALAAGIESVNRSPITVRCLLMLGMIIGCAIVLLNLNVLKSWATHRIAQKARNGEHAVANRLSLQSANGVPPEPAIISIDFERSRVGFRRRAIGA